MGDQRAEVEWRDGGVPVSVRFDDPYFSLDDGLAETQHVFLAGNDLPARFSPGFHIAELGFGTGLNLLAAWQTFRESGTGGKLHFTSFEAYPMTIDDMVPALKPFSHLGADMLLDVWADGTTALETDNLSLKVIVGDARETLPNWREKADAWFLDGFSPAKNPEMWEDTLLSEVGSHTNPGGTFATYTAAGFIRRALSDAGFAVTRSAGFGRKRHMSRGILE